jgi:hypothetical protein
MPAGPEKIVQFWVEQRRYFKVTVKHRQNAESYAAEALQAYAAANSVTLLDDSRLSSELQQGSFTGGGFTPTAEEDLVIAAIELPNVEEIPVDFDIPYNAEVEV